MTAVLCVTAVVFAADIIIKIIVRALDEKGRLPETICGKRIHLKRVDNPGMVFGLGKNHEKLVKFLPAAAITVIFLVFFCGMNRSNIAGRVGRGLVLGGALGNVSEHIARGKVTDYIRQPNFPKRKRKKWIYYNLADASLVAGVLLLLFDRK